MSNRSIRVVLGKVGLDGHDRGALVVARGLRDAGMEVIYTGLRRTPEELVSITMEEDADVIGLSILSGGAVELTRAVREELLKHDMGDVEIFVGGIIGPKAEAELKEMGVAAVFGPGSNVDTVAEEVAKRVANR